MGTILIKNGTVVTLGANNQVLHNHDLLIENNKIKKIGKKGTLGAADQTIDAHGKLVMPGFINAHMHYYSSFARGLGKAEVSKNFPEILKNLWWRLDRKLTQDDNHYSTLVANVDAIKKGTTTLIDHHASPYAVSGSLRSVADAVRHTGLRANLCYELSDRDGEKISQEGIEENVEFIKECQEKNDNQITALFGMHASFTISEKTMEKAVKAARDLKAGIHIHTAEDISDQNETVKMTGMRVVERLHKHGALGENTICAHCVHVNDHEMDLLAQTKTNVVHNPQSNQNNAVGVADIIKMNQKGILVGLGTDAMTVNMLEELRSAHWIHKLTYKDPSVGFMECANALALNNAKIAGKYFKGIGELKEGNMADVILIDYFSPTPLNEQTFLGHLIFGIPAAPVDTTICDGKVLMLNKKLTTIDEERIMAKAQELSNKLWQRF